MRKNSLNFALDAVSLLVMLAIAGTGLLMKFTLPPGSGAKSVWGMGRHAWGGVHFWLAATLLALLVLHIALHWAWVYATTRRVTAPHRPRVQRSFGRERTWGFAFLGLVVLVLGGFLAVAQRSIVEAPAASEEQGASEHGGMEHGREAEQ